VEKEVERETCKACGGLGYVKKTQKHSKTGVERTFTRPCKECINANP